MTALDLPRFLACGLKGRWLLDHPFYRRWERGEVSAGELRAYAEQYRHFEAFLPGFLARLVEGMDEGPARDLVAANLADERGDPVAHVELFERFAGALGAADEAPSPATAALLASYTHLGDLGPLPALAGFLAYECQASAVARTKADGLRRYYGLDDHAVSFWDHHATVDARHSEWVLDAADQSTDSLDSLIPWVATTAEAWWQFLDERQLAA